MKGKDGRTKERDKEEKVKEEERRKRRRKVDRVKDIVGR